MHLHLLWNLNERQILLKNIFKLEIELKILVKLEETPIYILF
jgi:hypothetical protein